MSHAAHLAAIDQARITGDNHGSLSCWADMTVDDCPYGANTDLPQVRVWRRTFLCARSGHPVEETNGRMRCNCGARPFPKR